MFPGRLRGAGSARENGKVGLILADYFSVVTDAELSESFHVDILGNKSHGTVSQNGMDTADVMRVEDGIGRISTGTWCWRTSFPVSIGRITDRG
tara:strand:+ start:223 stop:504 length:282 start_codon:yes stop_codon:yes gene_type:complete